MANPNESTVGTVVGNSVTLQGTLKDTGDIIIHGKVEGEVSSENSVIISEGAYVKGPISAEVAVITGMVKGSVQAKQKITIHTGGQVDGSISAPELVIESGARFNGKSTMALEKDPEPEAGELSEELEEIGKPMETTSSIETNETPTEIVKVTEEEETSKNDDKDKTSEKYELE